MILSVVAKSNDLLMIIGTHGRSCTYREKTTTNSICDYSLTDDELLYTFVGTGASMFFFEEVLKRNQLTSSKE